jgi:hypothetical protein
MNDKERIDQQRDEFVAGLMRRLGRTDEVTRAALAFAYTNGRRDHAIEAANRLRDAVMERDQVRS